MDFKRLRLQLRLRPENIDSDCNSDSASTPTQQEYFHPKMSNVIWSFSWFSFWLYLNGWCGDRESVCANCGCNQSWLSLFSLNGLDMTVFEFVAIVTQRSRWPQNYLRYPSSDEILSLNDASTYIISTLQLSFPSSLSMFSGRCIAVRPKSLSLDGCYPATPERSRSRQNFTGSSSDSDSRPDVRLPPTPTPASTLTPQPCFRGIIHDTRTIVLRWGHGVCHGMKLSHH